MQRWTGPATSSLWLWVNSQRAIPCDELRARVVATGTILHCRDLGLFAIDGPASRRSAIGQSKSYQLVMGGGVTALPAPDIFDLPQPEIVTISLQQSRQTINSLS